MLVLYGLKRFSCEPKAKVWALAKFFVLSKSLVLLNTSCEMFFVFYFRLGNRLDLLKENWAFELELFSAIAVAALLFLLNIYH